MSAELEPAGIGQGLEGTRGIEGAVRVAVLYLAGYSGNTRAAYWRDLRHFFEWAAVHKLEPLRATRAVIDLYVRALEDAGATAATIGRRLASISGFYRYAVGEAIIERDPTANVRRPKPDWESPRLGLDRGEARAFLEAAELAGPRDHAIACLLVFNGLRVSELCGLIRQSFSTERGHKTLEVTRKGGRKQIVPLAPRTVRALEDHLAPWGFARGQTGPLFLDDNRAPLDRHDVGRIVRRLARAAGIDKPISPHSLRHTFVTIAFDAGARERDVQAAAGHADPRHTARYDRARGQLDKHPTYAVAAWIE